MRHLPFYALFNGLVPTEYTETESEVLGVPVADHKKTCCVGYR